MKNSNGSHHTTDYSERAAQCDRLAGEAVTEENRQIFLMLATRWRRLAAEDEVSPPDKGGMMSKR